MENKVVDIIMPVHNRWEHTKQSLDSLVKNTDPTKYRLVIVNDKSDDFTTPSLYAWFMMHANDPKNDFIYLKNQENIGPGASRNRACDMITKRGDRAKYLYHSDNDVFFTPGWLEKLTEVFEPIKDVVAVLGGGCHPYLQNNNKIVHPFSGEQRRDWAAKGPHSMYNCSCGAPTVVGIKDAVSGYSQLMTWEVWDEFGPFDETMRNAEKKIMGSEDWAFCQKAIRAGYVVGSIEPEVVIATGKTNTYGEAATGSETFKEHDGITVK